MSVGILGTKVGMTQIFSEEGESIPVTVIEAGPCSITQLKTKETDGYEAVQIGYGAVKPKALNKPKLGHLSKSEAPPVRHLREYRTKSITDYQLGQTLSVDLFSEGQLVDVAGKSIGRGFAGYQKRHNFRRGPMSHGSKTIACPVLRGAGTTPGRIYPGKRMAGHMGDQRVSVRKLKVVKVDAERNLILIKGGVPGKAGTLLSITPATIVGQQ